MKKAYGYLRVSSKSQIDGDGFTRQQEEIEKFANAGGFEIAAIYREDISGTVDEINRPAFQEMLSAILKNGVRTVIVEGLDRLAREYRIQESILLFLASKDIELINARTGENVTESVLADPMKKALIQIQGVFSELEKNCLVKKLRTARQHKKETEGKCEGRKSYAEVKPEVVREIKALRRKRKGHEKPLSYSKIAFFLNDKGLTTVDGKPFTGANVAVILRRIK